MDDSMELLVKRKQTRLADRQLVLLQLTVGLCATYTISSWLTSDWDWSLKFEFSHPQYAIQAVYSR